MITDVISIIIIVIIIVVIITTTIIIIKIIKQPSNIKAGHLCL